MKTRNKTKNTKVALKPPLQALLVAPDWIMRKKILTGEKRITIREGHRDYRLGQVMISCHLMPFAVMAEIIEVRHCKLKEVTKEEWKNDGFTSQEDLLEGLRKFYPSINLDSPVTVIKWGKISGFLADSVQSKKLPFRALFEAYAKLAHWVGLELGFESR